MNPTLRNATILLAAATVALSTPPARAAGYANIGWTDCALAGPSTAAASFACNTNIGVHNLIASFEPPVAMTLLYGVEATLEVSTSAATLSPWWHFESTGCHTPSGLTASTDFTGGPFTCVDLWEGLAVSGSDYNPAFYSPNSSRIRVIAAVPTGLERTVNPGSEYYVFNVRISHSKTVGTCPGCTEGACFQFLSLVLRQSSSAGDYTLSSGPQQMVIWNGGGTSGCVVPVRKRTWGAIKSQYR